MRRSRQIVREVEPILLQSCLAVKGGTEIVCFRESIGPSRAHLEYGGYQKLIAGLDKNGWSKVLRTTFAATAKALRQLEWLFD
jgi:hypothetical protein